jgi:hypothetical protein
MQTNYFPKTLIFYTICMTILTASCKHGDKEEICTTSVAAISGTYKIASLKYKPTPTSPEQDFMFTLKDCEKDDLLTFKPNGSYSHEDKGIVCTPDRSNTGKWSLTGNTINSDGEVDGTIRLFDCSKLVVSVPTDLIDGDEMILTLQKQ